MFIEILKISIPALLLMITVIVVLWQIHKKELEAKKIEMISRNQKLITPLRLQSYERLILFLERIGPNHLIMRVQQPNMTVLELHRELLANIRTEYEHNLSQQLYVSAETWEMVKNTKENIIKLINTCAAEISPESNAMTLSTSIFEKLMHTNETLNQAAIDAIKKEIRVLF